MLSLSLNNGKDDDDTVDREDIIRSMLAHFDNPLVIQRSNFFCSTLIFWTIKRLDEMLSDDDMRTLFSSTQSVPVRLSSCCRDRSVCLSSSNFLLYSHLLMVPMASQPLMASLAYVHNTHRHTHSHAQTHTRYHTCTHTYTNIHTLTHICNIFHSCQGCILYV